MSRSNYSEECDGWELIMWRGAVTKAIKGKRGQAFLRELAAGMDAMSQKQLIAGELVAANGEACALGVVCKTRGLNVNGVDVEDSERISKLLGIADAMVREIEFQNDEAAWIEETPEQRWQRIRGWVATELLDERKATP